MNNQRTATDVTIRNSSTFVAYYNTKIQYGWVLHLLYCHNDDAELS